LPGCTGKANPAKGRCRQPPESSSVRIATPDRDRFIRQ
jgi:hypothetical protein